jgi:geranylgeranyl diphosphate synthase type I
MKKEEQLSIESILKEKAEPVHEEIDRVVSSFSVKELHEPLKYILRGGKQIRPVLTLLSCEAVGGCAKDAIPYAAAIELIHTASLVYDDIIDRDNLRRFHPALHRRFGDDIAVITGVVLVSKALEILSRDHRLNHLMPKTLVKMGEGQALDIYSNLLEDLSEERYLNIVRNKTASLMSASAEIGGIIGGGSAEDLSSLSDFGLSTGIAYQIRDDILGLQSNEETIGKAVRSDLSRGKLTIYSVHGFQSLKEQDKLRLRSILMQARELCRVNQETVATLRDIDDEIARILERAGSIEYAMMKAMEFVKKAKERLYVLRTSSARDVLEKIAEYAAMRKY